MSRFRFCMLLPLSAVNNHRQYEHKRSMVTPADTVKKKPNPSYHCVRTGDPGRIGDSQRPANHWPRRHGSTWRGKQSRTSLAGRCQVPTIRSKAANCRWPGLHHLGASFFFGMPSPCHVPRSCPAPLPFSAKRRDVARACAGGSAAPFGRYRSVKQLPWSARQSGKLADERRT
jgi:hypothetical protein